MATDACVSHSNRGTVAVGGERRVRVQGMADDAGGGAALRGRTATAGRGSACVLSGEEQATVVLAKVREEFRGGAAEWPSAGPGYGTPGVGRRAKLQFSHREDLFFLGGEALGTGMAVPAGGRCVSVAARAYTGQSIAGPVPTAKEP